MITQTVRRTKPASEPAITGVAVGLCVGGGGLAFDGVGEDVDDGSFNEDVSGLDTDDVLVKNELQPQRKKCRYLCWDI